MPKQPTRKTALHVVEVLRARELYFELDARGRQFRSIDEIAELYGVGYTTMYRAIHGQGPYGGREFAGVREEAEEKLDAEMQGALERLQKVAKEEKKGDALIEELIKGAGTENAPISEAVKEKAKKFLRE